MTIQLTSINCFYREQQVLCDLCLEIASGETVAILGPSGAGKSTLLRVFNLLTKPQSGSLTLHDVSIDFTHPLIEQKVRQLRRYVGIIFQQYHLWPHLTLLANLTIAPRTVLKLDAAAVEVEALALLARLGLSAHAHRYPLQLSGGQQQRVAIARALMMQPQVLLFDEPTAALDPEVTTQITEIIHELSATGITQVVVTHNVEMARKVARRIIYMEHGKIIEMGDHSLFEQPQTAEFANYLAHANR